MPKASASRRGKSPKRVSNYVPVDQRRRGVLVPGELVTRSEICTQSGLSEDTIRSLTDEGMPTVKIGGRYMYWTTDVIDYLVTTKTQGISNYPNSLTKNGEQATAEEPPIVPQHLKNYAKSALGTLDESKQ